MSPFTHTSRTVLALLGALTTSAWAAGNTPTALPYGSGYESRQSLVTQPAVGEQTPPLPVDTPKDKPAADNASGHSGGSNAGGRSNGSSSSSGSGNGAGGGNRGGRGR